MSSFIFYCDKTLCQKVSWRGKGLFLFTSYSLTFGKPEQELKEGIMRKELRQRHRVILYVPCLASPFYVPGPLVKDGTFHSGGVFHQHPLIKNLFYRPDPRPV